MNAYQEYIRLDFEWTLARRAAGGQLSPLEEVEWTQRLDQQWQRMTEEERRRVDAVPVGDREFAFVDVISELGKPGVVRTRAA